MPRTLLRVNLQSIKVKSNGDLPKDKPPAKPTKEKRNNLIVATLLYPHSGAPSVVSTKEANLMNGTAKNFDPANFWTSGLFKEEIQGEAKLQIQVLDRDRVSKFTKFVAGLVGAVMGAGLGLVTAGISNAILGAIANFGAKSASGLYELGDDETLEVIGTAEKVLTEGKIPESLVLQLKAPRAIKKQYYAQKTGGGDTKFELKEETLIKKGQNNGTVSLTLREEALA